MILNRAEELEHGRRKLRVLDQRFVQQQPRDARALEQRVQAQASFQLRRRELLADAERQHVAANEQRTFKDQQ